MTWSRVEDDMHENRKLRRLSHAAFRLYWIAISWSRKHQTGGSLYADDVHELCTRHAIKRHGSAILELVKAPYDYEIGLWVEQEPGLYQIHDFDQYNPPTSTERVRKYRAKARQLDPNGTGGNVSDTVSEPLQERSSRADTRAGYPNPKPKPVTGASHPSPPLPPQGGGNGSKDPEQRGVAEYQPLLDCWQELGGRLPSADDIKAADGFWGEFQRPTAEEMAEACRWYADKRSVEGHQRIRKLMLYREVLRQLNDRLADQGRLPRSTTVGNRNAGLAKVRW